MNLSRKEAEAGIEKVAAKLKLLSGAPRFVFIGGGSIPLQVTVQRDETEYRLTKDIDVVISVATYADYNEVSVQLRRLGFRDDMQLPIRWYLDDLMVDVLPITDIGHGLGNRWFHLVMKLAVERKLAGGTMVELAAAPVLLATKLEAFVDRGMKDVLASHDLEDIVTLLDGRPEIVDESHAMPTDLKEYLAEQAKGLLALNDLGDVLEGNLQTAGDDAGRALAVASRLRALAEMK